MPWSQNYLPLGGLTLSTLVAALPVVLLLLLLLKHVRAHYAALAGLLCAGAIALLAYGMPVKMVAASALYGAMFGLFPIGWIVLNAIFIYQLSVETGQFEVLKQHVAGFAADKRLQLLFIAFCFGAFLEGCAGFGAPVAITGAMLIGLGFKPLEAAKLVLIGNTAPVAFGSLGIPLTTMSTVTGLDLHALSSMVGRQLPFFSLIVPFWLVAAYVGWRKMREVWPACLACGLSFGIVQFAVSNFHGPWLVDLASALAAIIAMLVLLRFWKPATHDAPAAAPAKLPASVAFRAWLPWLVLTLFVSVWTVQGLRDWLNHLSAPKLPIPGLYGLVMRVPPVVPVPIPEKAEYLFNWLSATGTALFMAGCVAGLLLGVKPRALLALYGRTVMRVRLSLLTITLMLALGYTTKFCGSDITMGLAFASTGSWFPFFSPLLGWLGVALTGSDTSSNVLFGNLQQATAQQTGLSPILACAANSSGGVMGKMIDAQSIVVAQTATDSAAGDEPSPTAGDILRAVFWHSVVLAILVGVLVWVQARWLPWMVPR